LLSEQHWGQTTVFCWTLLVFLAEVIPMPRLARLILLDILLHIIQHGNNCQACFFADGDYSVYLGWLGEHASKPVAAFIPMY
jgi:hypothetical protein